MKTDNIPKTLDEAVTYVKNSMLKTSENIHHIMCADEDDFVCECHFSYAMALRNEWKLWVPGTPLVEWFNNIGIYHPDDMSAIIITSVYRSLHRKDISLNEQIEYYRDYWERTEPNVNRGKFGDNNLTET